MHDELDRRLDKWGNDAGRHPWLTLLRWALAITLIVLACVALVGLLTTGSVFFKAAAAKRTIGARVTTQVYTPENAIAQIAFFHDTCQQAVAQQQIVTNNQARYDNDLKASRSTDPIRQQQAEVQLAQDQQDVAGAQNALASTVAAYNSRSAQSTANVFKNSDLPERLSANDTISCG